VHPALSGLIIDFFYNCSASVGKLFPEVFGQEILRVMVAIAATAVGISIGLYILICTNSLELGLLGWAGPDTTLYTPWWLAGRRRTSVSTHPQ